MMQVTAAELLYLQEQMRSAIAGTRFLNHCANETADARFKGLCQQFAAETQAELQQAMSLLNGINFLPSMPQ